MQKRHFYKYKTYFSFDFFLVFLHNEGDYIHPQEFPMHRQEMPYEEHPMLPEHIIPQEYTPVFPDVSFFRESFVTMREENVSQGQDPPGEDRQGASQNNKKASRTPFSWLRNFLGSALRGGAAIFAAGSMVVTMVSGADLPEDSPWYRVKTVIQEFRGDSFRKVEDYGPKELQKLWEGDPEGPHQYDFEHAHVRREASCGEDGLIEYLCSQCGVALQETIPGGHAPLAAVKENERAAGCTEEGGYDSVVYCSVCGDEISREHYVYEAAGHTSAEPVIENIVGALCTEGGHYDSVVYCDVCHQELSRETVSTEAMGHTAAAAVKENEQAPTCTAEGSYESVVYCGICHAELSRETVAVEATGHRAGYAEKENEQEASCTAEGSYDSVVYCMVCGEELSRETVTLPMTEHIETQDQLENHRDPGCITDGSEEIAVYCDVCGMELSRRRIVLTATGHTDAAPVTEGRTEASCTAEGGYDTVVYCSVCGEELSRVHTTLAILPHTAAAAVQENRRNATCTTAGSYDEVVYCSSCGTELSRARRSIAATGHSAGSAQEENRVAASCTAEGGYDSVVYCTTCGAEISRTHVTLNKLEHTAAAAVRENVQAATCTAAGSYDEVVYCSACHAELSRTAQTVAATGHDWGEPTYTWDPDYESVTATHVCRNDASHTESETAIPIGTVTTEASCTAAGVLTFTASFSNSALGTARKTEPIAALGHTFPVETWNQIYDDVTGERQSPVVVCDRCGTPALTISFVNANTINYTIDADFWEQASEALGFFEWGDCVAFEDESRAYGIGYIDSAYDEATSRTGTIVLDFIPVSGQTYYYNICLRVATSGSSDDVCFVAPSGGEKQTYTQP